VRIQVLSDLHVEFSQGFRPTPAANADVLVTAGDLGHTPEALAAFAGWPVPVIAIPGNHEYDGSDLRDADEELEEIAAACGIVLLNKGTHTVGNVRFLGCARWWDFDLLGPHRRDECMQWGARYLRHMGSARAGRPLTTQDVRELAQDHRAWLEAELANPWDGPTVVITHSAPSGRSADPRYGLVAGTASFCNSDDDLVPLASLWIHGHLHCAHDYTVEGTRVVCNPRGYVRLREHEGYVDHFVVEV
jgi:Icc-related predicted phosphoesterase